MALERVRPGTAIGISAALQQAGDAAGVKLLPALQRLGGNRALYTRTLGAFMAELRLLDEQLALPVSTGRHLELARQLHPLKGLAATAGLERLAEVTRQSEAWMKSADPQVCQAAVAQVQKAIVEHLPALDAMHALLLSEAQGQAGVAQAELLPEKRLAILDRLQGLREQLAAEDFDALHTLALIQEMGASNLCESLEPLREAMAQLDFDAALQQCALLIAQMYARTELST